MYVMHCSKKQSKKVTSIACLLRALNRQVDRLGMFTVEIAAEAAMTAVSEGPALQGTWLISFSPTNTNN
jgi:hypothetical protein